MLIIRRRAGESILIGEEIEVEILEISGSQIKLGIRAPREVTVLRREIVLTMHANQLAAADVSEAALSHFDGILR